MNQDQSEQVLKVMAATWPGEMTDDRIVAWVDTLREILPAHAREAIRDLKRVKTFLPSHAEFFEAIEAIKTRESVDHEERMLAEPGGAFCVCGGAGWVEVDTEGQGHVERCQRCNPTPATKDAEGNPIAHAAGCTCGRCHYGPKRWSIIQSGRDGMGPRRTTVENEDTPPPPDHRYEKAEF